jgi:hypothetical protein
LELVFNSCSMICDRTPGILHQRLACHARWLPCQPMYARPAYSPAASDPPNTCSFGSRQHRRVHGLATTAGAAAAAAAAAARLCCIICRKTRCLYQADLRYVRQNNRRAHLRAGRWHRAGGQRRLLRRVRRVLPHLQVANSNTRVWSKVRHSARQQRQTALLQGPACCAQVMYLGVDALCRSGKSSLPQTPCVVVPTTERNPDSTLRQHHGSMVVLKP